MTSLVPETRRDEAIQMALLLREQGHVDLAIDTVRRAVSEDLSDLKLVVTLAKLLSETGQLDKAERWFKRAMEIDPWDLDVRVGQATWLGQRGHLDACRAAFSDLCKDLAAELKGLDTDVDSERIDAIGSALAVAGVNLANCALLSGNYEGAVRFASCWLAHPDHWETAHDIVAHAVEHGDIDPQALAERGLESGEISPLMLLFLLEDALEKQDLRRLLDLIERGNATFAFDWQREADELERTLSAGDVLFRRALMRGDIDEDDLASWLAQRSA